MKSETSSSKASKSKGSNALKEKDRARKIFDALSKRWPEAKCELEHNTPFQLLLAVVLSAQTTDKAVNKALGPLFQKTPDFGPRDLVQLGEKGFFQIIKSIGLAPTKARNSFLLSQMLLAKHNGQVPDQRQNLEELPGVGRKTANVVLNELFGHPTVAIDTHLARLSFRMGFSESPENRVQIEEDLLSLIPKAHLIKAHHYLIFHGRYLCQARKPQCEVCPIEKICPKEGVLQ